MEFGCHLPVYGPAATRETLLAFARRMEALGYDSLWASDHVVIPWRIASKYPYNETGDFPLPASANFLEPLTALALVAGATERIRLGTTVLVLRSEEHTSELQSQSNLVCRLLLEKK